MDPAVRDGLQGPESGKEIVVEEDCWLGGNVILLPGVRVGRGSTVGAGSVVTKVSNVHQENLAELCFPWCAFCDERRIWG